MISADVLCVGEVLVQISPVDGTRLSNARSAVMSLGGAEANVAVVMAVSGVNVAWGGPVGNDPLGHGLLAQLAEYGVDVTHASLRNHEFTGVYFKDPMPEGSVPYYYRANSAASHLNRAAARELSANVRPKVVHISGVTAALSRSAEEFVDEVVIRRAFGDATVSFDVNFRPSLAKAETPEILRHFAQAADIAFVGRDEAERVWGTKTVDETRTLLGNKGILVVKDGANEAVSFVGAQRVSVPAPRVDVVEPTGAGDAFAAGWLTAWLDKMSIQDCLRRGHREAGRALRTRHDVSYFDEEVT